MTDPTQENAGAPAADQGAQGVTGPGAATGGTTNEPAAGAAKPAVTMGRIVIVRETGKKDAPGIVAEVAEDGSITCNVFRGDHIPHVASRLTQIEAETESTGWFFPPRV